MRLKKKSIIVLSAISVLILVLNNSCETITGNNSNNNNLVESLAPVEEVSLVPGGEDATITVKKNTKTSYFNISFSKIRTNKVIQDGVREGWCIDWTKPIDSNGGTYSDIKLYATNGVEQWKPINYLFNIEDELKQEDPALTWREIQLAIWSLRGNPEFNLDNVAIKDLPSEMQTDGQPKFDANEVKKILNIVKQGYKKFNFQNGTKSAVIAATPSDVQTIITVVDN